MTVRKCYEARARGTAAECLVEADLLLRGLEVTRPSVDYGDDLHARFNTGWRSVQVKVRDPKRKTWRASSSNRSRVSSEILALVDGKTREIRYYSTFQDPLPSELQ
jgi:hypothetical protein